MSSGTDGRNRLNPEAFIYFAQSILSRDSTNETLLRRMISGLFFSLYNYWGLTKYLRGEKGKGSKQDSFSTEVFYQDLLEKGKDMELVELIYYRVAADHHISNPTRVRLYLSKNLKFGEREIEITPSSLRRLIGITLELAKIIE